MRDWNEKEEEIVFELTNFAIIIGIKCLIDRTNNMFNFVYVTGTHIFITFDHIFFCHFSVRTPRLKRKSFMIYRFDEFEILMNTLISEGRGK